MTNPVDRAAPFIWTSARLIDRQRFRWLFAGGTAEAVHAALRPYQNPDGGFGNALEPDLRTPASQPVPAEVAVRIILETGPGPDRTVIQRLCDFLTTITTDEGGVPFVLPTARDFPAAPWWQAPPEPPASPNPTAALVGLLSALDVKHPWLGPATAYSWRTLASEQGDEHSMLAKLTFLQYVPDRDRAEQAFAVLGAHLLAKGMVALDPAAEGYVKKPLDWAPRPDSLCRRLFDDRVLAAHLDALIAAQQPDGGWPITWSALSPAAEAEWRGAVTVDALKTLAAYGRLDG